MPVQKGALMAALNAMQAGLTKNSSEVCTGDVTTHPAGGGDNGTVAVREGERSRENESDVKEQVPGDNVQVAEGQGYDANGLAEVQAKGGLNATTVGEDSASEDNYKDKLKDPGTSHPAAVGEKYGKVSYADNVKAAGALSDAILAALAVSPASKSAATTPATPAANVAPVAEVSKEASADTIDFIAATTRDAVAQADMLGQYLHQFKKASEEIPPPEESPEGAPPAAGGEGAPAAPPAAEMGADPAMSDPAMAGAAAPAPAPAPPGGAPGGDPSGMGGVPQEEALQQLVAGLAEMGITPEMLMAASQAAPPIPGGADVEKMAYVATRALDFMRSGKYRIEEAKNAHQRTLREDAKAFCKTVFKL